MKTFDFTIEFNGLTCPAQASVLCGNRHTQYTVSPIDKKLFSDFGNQVFHRFGDKPLQVAFPGTTEPRKVFAAAVAKALQKYLDQSTPAESNQ